MGLLAIQAREANKDKRVSKDRQAGMVRMEREATEEKLVGRDRKASKVKKEKPEMMEEMERMETKVKKDLQDRMEEPVKTVIEEMQELMDVKEQQVGMERREPKAVGVCPEIPERGVNKEILVLRASKANKVMRAMTAKGALLVK